MSDIDDKIPNDFEIVEQPSYTYKMILPKTDSEELRVIGNADELDAVQQAVYKILNTERYTYPIYSWNYGIELADLFGQPLPWVYPELEMRITEALTWDDRINSVSDFEFEESNRNVVHAKFTVNSIFGSFESEMNVRV